MKIMGNIQKTNYSKQCNGKINIKEEEKGKAEEKKFIKSVRMRMVNHKHKSNKSD